MKAIGFLKGVLGRFSSSSHRVPKRRPQARARAARLGEAAAEVLESRMLLSANPIADAPQVGPQTGEAAPAIRADFTDISGWWLFGGKGAQVLQLQGVITFINENGGVSSGHFATSTQVVADGWGGLEGTLVGTQIQWTNGSTWDRIPDLTMNAVINGTNPVLVQQLGINLKFTNEFGGMSTGHFINSTQFVADNWGSLKGTLVTNQISWGNGTIWTAANPAFGVGVNVSGAWEINGQDATILQWGTNILFVNEHGTAARGTLIDTTHVVATDWGNLLGTIDIANRRIAWSNGSKWDRIPVLDHNENWHTDSLQPTAISQMGVRIVFTNEHGNRSEGRYVPLTGVLATGWSLGGTVDFVNAQIIFDNASIWHDSQFGFGDANFAAVNNWPWLG